MKYAIVIISIIILLILISQAFVLKTNREIETYSYEVLAEIDDIEIRRYEAAWFASYTMPQATYKESSGMGFRTLAGYIFGKNEESVNLPMTAPVSMDMKDSVTMRFLLPSSLDKNNIPVPLNKDIVVSELPGKVVAAISFGGWADDEKISLYRDKLKFRLKENGIRHDDFFTFQGYNSPFDLTNRKNEILVNVELESVVVARGR